MLRGISSSSGRMVLFKRGSAGTSVSPLVLPSTPIAIYSVARYNSWAGACVRIERSSDSAQADIGFDANGYMNATAAFTFAGADTIRVVTWYDQSGNGWHITATSNWPTIISGNTLNGKQPLTFINSAGAGNIKLSSAAGLTINTQSFTACMAYASGGGLLNFNSLFGIGTQVNIWWEKYTGVLQGSSLFTGGDKNLFTPRQAQVDSMTLSGSATQRILTNNGNTQTVGTAYSAADTVGITVGTSSVVTTIAHEPFAFVLYNTALSAGNKTLVNTAFSTAFGSGAANTSKIIYDGDSITCGITNCTNSYLYGWPRVVEDTNGRGAEVVNVAVPGSNMTTCYTNRAQITGRYNSGYAKNVSVIFAGTNDIDNRASGTIVGYGTTVWTTATLPYILAMQAASFSKVLVGTAIARTWAGSAQDKLDKEAERLAYNQLIRDNAVANSYEVVDFAGLSQMSTSTDLTYFVDGVHPTKLGFNVMGTYAAPIIAPYT